MIVFEYFFRKMDVFGPKMDKMTCRDSLEMKDMKEVCFSVLFFVSLCTCVFLSGLMLYLPSAKNYR